MPARRRPWPAAPAYLAAAGIRACTHRALAPPPGPPPPPPTPVPAAHDPHAEDGRRCGAATFCFLGALRRRGLGLSYEQLLVEMAYTCKEERECE